MKIRFVGTGEALDGNRMNTSILVDDRILLDCGYGIAHALVQEKLYEKVDYLCLSHFHGDHFAGTSALLLIFGEEKRSRPFEFIGPAGIKDVMANQFSFHYGKHSVDELDCALKFTEMSDGAELDRDGYQLVFCKTRHTVPSFAVKVTHVQSGVSVVYTGDTEISDELVSFFEGSDMVIAECYEADGHHQGHSSAVVLGEKLAAVKKPSRVAVVHCSRHRDRNQIRSILAQSYAGEILMPEDGDIVEV
ncbi:MBL fold metallo-hydrolase [Verrucomicrobiota bacterium]